MPMLILVLSRSRLARLLLLGLREALVCDCRLLEESRNVGDLSTAADDVVGPLLLFWVSRPRAQWLLFAVAEVFDEAIDSLLPYDAGVFELGVKCAYLVLRPI